MAATITDIAKALDISPSTVSRALKNPKLISIKTRDLVLKKAQELGYISKLRQSAFASENSKIIGIIVADISNAFNNKLVKSLMDVFSANDYSVILGTSYEDPLIENKILRQWLDFGLCGLVVMPTEKFIHSYSQTNLNIPVIQIDRCFDTENLDSVTEDNVYGASLAVEYLLSLNHKRIAFISGDNSVFTFSQRCKGALQSGKDNVEIISLTSKAYEDLYIGAFEKTNFLMMRGRARRPTAIIGANNAITSGIVYALNLKGIKIPDEVSVISYGDSRWCRFFNPPITAVVQPVEQIGTIAANNLIKRITLEDSKVEQVCLQSMLLTRASTSAI